MDLSFPNGDDKRFEARRLRLSTIINTRWLAIAGQALTISFVFGYLRFDMAIVACSLLIAVSVVANMVLTWSYPPNHRLEPPAVFAILVFDVFQLAGLLYYTGGLENPFGVLLVVPVVIAAVSLPGIYTIALGLLVFVAASVLVFTHEPVPWFPGSELDVPFMYLMGFWAAVIVSLAFSTFYIARVATETRQLTDALAETELVLQREMHLSALDGLAAAAAHELGTPLATISLVAKEMERSVEGPPDLKEDITLLRTQAERCREILGRLSTLQTTSEMQMTRLPLLPMMEEVVAPHREFGVQIDVNQKDCKGPEPVGRRNPGIIYGLGNIVENAVDFATERVRIDVSWDDERVLVEIIDDGPGFAVEQIERLGEPDLAVLSDPARPRRGGNGLGLGVFIAKTLLERSGAKLRFANAKDRKGGAWVAIAWPRPSIDTYLPYDDQEERDHERTYAAV